MTREQNLARKRAWYWANRGRALSTARRYREGNPEKVRQTCKASYAKNREASLTRNKQWRANNPEHAREIGRRSAKKNAKKHCEKQRQYREANPHAYRKWAKKNREARNAYMREFRRRNPTQRLAAAVRCRVHEALKLCGLKKDKPLVKLLGYPVTALRSHLEARFLPGMTWDNYGSEWQVDHVRPVASFAFTSTDDPQFKECWALRNLQPLWKIDNLRKNSEWNGRRRHDQRSSR